MYQYNLLNKNSCLDIYCTKKFLEKRSLYLKAILEHFNNTVIYNFVTKIFDTKLLFRRLKSSFFNRCLAIWNREKVKNIG